ARSRRSRPSSEPSGKTIAAACRAGFRRSHAKSNCAGLRPAGTGGTIMAAETTFRIVFWVLLALVLVIRAYFAFRVRRAGERLMPDRAAVKREGTAAFAARVIAFFALIGWLVAY